MRSQQASGSTRLERDGIAWGTEAFFRDYQQSIRQLLAEAGRRGWPPLIINFGDDAASACDHR